MRNRAGLRVPFVGYLRGNQPKHMEAPPKTECFVAFAKGESNGGDRSKWMAGSKLLI